MIATGGSNLNDATVAPIIEKAFAAKPKAVAIEVNSPGGSPTQSALIAARIRRLADEKSIPVYVFVEDVAASGGYWLATVGDEIYVDQSSIVGSIGVISSGFGLHDFIDRHGVERRVHTAGGNKSFMDPFKPENPEEVGRLKQLLDDIHAVFVDHVKSRRTGLAEDADLFTGRFWLGAKAIDLGLADHIGHLVPVMKDKLGDKTRFKRFQRRRSVFRRFGAQMLTLIEERSAYARFGL